ncbi:MAG: hypothetical protein GXP61_07460, partial [Epsilonproteobacteria bacterium]|nr:hypothetical protein [Campylobacterota bacterium]
MKYTKINFQIFDYSQLLPEFMGSALRGAFGYSLKKVVCINPSFTCRDCFAKVGCLYYDFYEKTDSYHKYRFDIKLNQKEFNFNLFLFDSACDKVPYVLSAIHKMLSETGIGRDRKTSKDFHIKIDNKMIYSGDSFSIPKEYAKVFKTTDFSSNIILKFITPFRTKKNNHLLRSDPPLELILSSVQNRANRLRDKKLERLSYVPTYEIVEFKVYFKEL